MLINSTDYRRQPASKAYGFDSGKARSGKSSENSSGDGYGAFASRISSESSPFRNFTNSRISSSNTENRFTKPSTYEATPRSKGIQAYQTSGVSSFSSGIKKTTSSQARSLYSPVTLTPAFSASGGAFSSSAFSPASILQSGINAYQSMGMTSYSASAIQTGASIYKSAGSMLMNTGGLFLSF